MIRVGEAIEVDIDRVDRAGDGVGVIDGVDVIVTGVFPGERALVRVLHRSKAAPRLHGRAKAILSPAPDRREPPCERHVERGGQCTGCPWQGLGEGAQRALKRAMLRDHFGLEVDAVVALADGELRYRGSSKRVVAGRPGALRLGSYRQGSHEVADMRGCLVDHPAIVAAARELTRAANALEIRPFGPAGEGAGEGELRYVWFKCDGRGVLVTLIGAASFEARARALAERLRLPVGVAFSVQEAAGNAIRGAEAIVLAGEGALGVELAGVGVRVGPLGFLQPNPRVAALAYHDLVRGPGGERLSGDLALDLYAGAGVTTGLLRRDFAAVIPCESNPESAAALGQPPVAVDDFLAAYEGPTPALVIANPPRAGLGPAVVARLAALAAPRLQIMSCSPAALAGDLAGLTAAGYRLVGLRAYDTLPQTPHVELIAWLEGPVSSDMS